MNAGSTRIRVHIAEALLADVINELTRLGAAVEDLRSTDGNAVLTAATSEGQIEGFERWLAVFAKGAGRVETIDHA
jgi:hypothetical protein